MTHHAPSTNVNEAINSGDDPSLREWRENGAGERLRRATAI